MTKIKIEDVKCATTLLNDQVSSLQKNFSMIIMKGIQLLNFIIFGNLQLLLSHYQIFQKFFSRKFRIINVCH